MTGGSTESQDEQRRVEKQKGNNYKAPPGPDEENQTRSSDRVAMDRAEQQHAGEPEGPPAARAFRPFGHDEMRLELCVKVETTLLIVTVIEKQNTVDPAGYKLLVRTRKPFRVYRGIAD